MARPKNVVAKYVGPIDPPTPSYGVVIAANHRAKLGGEKVMQLIEAGCFAEARWQMRAVLLDIATTRRYLENV